jgi:hypothetical protein
MKSKWGIYVVNGFSVLMMVIGTTLMVLEGIVHYRPYLTRKPTGTVIVANWTATPFIVGGILVLFGALILGYTIVKPALVEFEGLLPFLTSLLQSVKPWGQRATDKQAAAAAVVKPDPDEDKK